MLPQDRRVLLTVPEAAGLLRISRAKIYELLMSGQLRSVRIGSRRLVPVDAVTEFIGACADA